MAAPKKIKVSRSSLAALHRDMDGLSKAEDRMRRLIFLDELAGKLPPDDVFWSEVDRDGEYINYEPDFDKLRSSSVAYEIWDGEAIFSIMDGCESVIDLQMKTADERRVAIEMLRPVVRMFKARVAAYGIELEG